MKNQMGGVEVSIFKLEDSLTSLEEGGKIYSDKLKKMTFSNIVDTFYAAFHGIF